MSISKRVKHSEVTPIATLQMKFNRSNFFLDLVALN
jgi:hypothetical protein